ncbi:hypothetical protein ACFPRL_14895 [Pseudoclavibacter helvolus]
MRVRVRARARVRVRARLQRRRRSSFLTTPRFRDGFHASGWVASHPEVRNPSRVDAVAGASGSGRGRRRARATLRQPMAGRRLRRGSSP